MAVDRPDWSFETPDTNRGAGEHGFPDSPKPDAAPADSKAVATVESKSASKPDGIAREDWGTTKSVDAAPPPPAQVPTELGKDGRARDEGGQFLSKANDALRQQWAREGGYEVNKQRVLDAEASILAVSENPVALEVHMATLPEDIQRKAADHMRLSTSYGPKGGALKFEAFVNSLSPSEFETFTTWWKGLSRGDQDAILGVISR